MDTSVSGRDMRMEHTTRSEKKRKKTDAHRENRPNEKYTKRIVSNNFWRTTEKIYEDLESRQTTGKITKILNIPTSFAMRSVWYSVTIWPEIKRKQWILNGIYFDFFLVSCFFVVSRGWILCRMDSLSDGFSIGFPLSCASNLPLH